MSKCVECEVMIRAGEGKYNLNFLELPIILCSGCGKGCASFSKEVMEKLVKKAKEIKKRDQAA